MECLCQVLNQLAEVNALIGDVVEDGLVSITLILHVAYLHVQTESLGNLTALNHCRVLASLSLTPLLKVVGACYAVYALYVIRRFYVHLLKL